MSIYMVYGPPPPPEVYFHHFLNIFLDHLGDDCLPFQNIEIDHVSINKVLKKYSHEFNRKDNKHFTRITLVMGIITIAFLICWWPYAILFMLKSGSKYDIPGKWIWNVVVLAYFNSLINPVLYIFINKDVRQSVVNLFTCKNIEKIERFIKDQTSFIIRLTFLF